MDMQEKRKSNVLLRFLFRGVLGLAVIFVVNQCLNSQGISMQVGYNGVSFLTSGILGIPGVVLLYGILGFQFL